MAGSRDMTIATKGGRAAFIALALLVFAGLPCASAPKPAWVDTPPAATATEVFFTGLGTAAGKDEAAATESATTSLVASIMMYIGVDMSVVTTSSLREEMGKINSEYSQTVQGKAANRIAGFKLVGKWPNYDSKAKSTTVHILASYRKTDLEKEKARVAQLLREKEDAVSLPEAEGKALLAEGSNWDALGRFVDAVVAAAGSSIDNADIKAQRNLANAREAIKSLRVQIAPPVGPIWSGEPYPGPFTLRLLSGSDGRGVPGASLLVGYPRKQGTRVIQKTVTVTTDDKGMVAYTPPPPDFVGKGRLTVQVDFSAQSILLDGLPQRWTSGADQLRDAFSAVSAESEVAVASRARQTPLSIALVDQDAAGSLLGESVSAEALSGILTGAGFVLVPLNLAPDLVAFGKDEAIKAAAAMATKAPRLLYGSTKLLGVRKDGAMWIADARVSAKVVELASGRILYSIERQVSALGSDEASASRAALREAGASGLGKDLLSSLP